MQEKKEDRVLSPCVPWALRRSLKDNHSFLENEILKSMEAKMYREMLAKSRIYAFLSQPWGIFEVEMWNDLLRQRREVLFLKMPLLVCWPLLDQQWHPVAKSLSTDFFVSRKGFYCFGWSSNSEQNHFCCLYPRIPEDTVLCNTKWSTKGHKEEMEGGSWRLAVVFIFPMVLLKRMKIQEGMNICVCGIPRFSLPQNTLKTNRCTR